MARKSAKNKKALRRKSEASKRSRLLKQRQDYTKGGRVKAANGFAGFDPNDPSTWPQQVRRQGTVTPSTLGTGMPGQGGQSDIVPTPVKTRPDLTGGGGPGFGTGVQLPDEVAERFGIPSDIRTTPQTPTPGVIGVGQTGVGTSIELPTISEEDKNLLASQGVQGTQRNLGAFDYSNLPPDFDPTNPTTWPPDFNLQEYGEFLSGGGTGDTGDTGDTGTKEDDTTSDYGSRPGKEPKEFSEDDYTRISRDGGDSDADGRISGDEWTTWMLNKGPDEGVNAETGVPFRTSWQNKLQQAVNSGVLSNSVIDEVDKRLVKDLLDNQDADAGKTLTPSFYNPRTRLTQEQIRSLNNTGSKFVPMWDEEGFSDFSYAQSTGWDINWPISINPPGRDPIKSSETPETYISTKTGEILHFPFSGNIPPSDEWVKSSGGNAREAANWDDNKDGVGDYPGQEDPPDKVELPPIDWSSNYPIPLGPRSENETDEEYAIRSERYEYNVNLWNSMPPHRRARYFSYLGEGNPETIDELERKKAEENTQVGDPAQDVVDRIRYQLPRVDAPTAIDTVDTDLESTEGKKTLTSDDDIQKLDDYKDIGDQTISAQPTSLTKGEVTRAQTPMVADIAKFDSFQAEEVADTKFAQSQFEREAKATEGDLRERTRAVDIDREREEASKGEAQKFERFPIRVDPVTGKPTVMVDPGAAEERRRNAILDEVPAEGTEAVIKDAAGYEAAERRELKGEAARGDAVSFLQKVSARGDLEAIPPSLAEVILDNPAVVAAEMDQNPTEVHAAISALPNEALVSAQLESLLAGIDDGVTPPWARPVVQLVNSRMSARGLNVSTVGRDALFNAIIQTALPIAQSNATALQQRANQNLSNQQQANLQQATQEMQLRLSNLGNRQTAGSQTAQLAQQINLAQGDIEQQFTLTESQQRQQARLQSLQNEQQASMANLGNDQQIEMANLQIEAERLGANQSAINQERLAEFQVAASFLDKNAGFKQQMEVANLTNDQQMRLAFLTAKNQAASENLSTAQQTELANLNKRVELNKTNATLAQQMGLAQLNVDQQQAMQNASVVANMDLTEFNAAQQMEIANSKFMQTMTLQDFNQRQQATIQDATSLASMDLQSADSLTKVSIENARNFLQVDLANLNTEQQAHILNSQQSQQTMLTNAAAENAARQFNATSENQRNQFMANLGAQMEQFNASQANAMEQFNATEANRLSAIDAGNALEASKAQAGISNQINQFNEQMDLQRDQWNAQNEQAVIQSNINWRRQLNLSETAAENAANQQAASQVFQLTAAEQSFLWQTLRDEATYLRQQYESDQTRRTNLYATALSNESEAASSSQGTMFNLIDSKLGGKALSSADIGRITGNIGPYPTEDNMTPPGWRP